MRSFTALVGRPVVTTAWRDAGQAHPQRASRLPGRCAKARRGGGGDQAALVHRQRGAGERWVDRRLELIEELHDRPRRRTRRAKASADAAPCAGSIWRSSAPASAVGRRRPEPEEACGLRRVMVAAGLALLSARRPRLPRDAGRALRCGAVASGVERAIEVLRAAAHRSAGADLRHIREARDRAAWRHRLHVAAARRWREPTIIGHRASSIHLSRLAAEARGRRDELRQLIGRSRAGGDRSRSPCAPAPAG